MMSVNDKVLKLAFLGEWDTLLPVLRNYPHLINLPSEPKGYTPLHQAAWHGATLPVIGELLFLGADRSITTHSRRQTAYDIVIEKHKRPDLEYLLFPKKVTIAQIIRKVVLTEPQIFEVYDGNLILVDKLIAAFGVELRPDKIEELENRLHHLFFALTGQTINAEKMIKFDAAQGFSFDVNPAFFGQTFFPLICRTAQAEHNLVESEWATVSDLFEPSPTQWGLRGDLFLWLEMRQSLCQVSLPKDTDELADIISAAFQALTGKSLISRVGDNDFFVERFSRGGMSSGYVSSLYWLNEFIPQLQARLNWLQTAGL
ncbi:ankyrin repeat domain-containing protein [Erwinia sorbitola]|uniref:Ankyrin repeat domain-containing protein n=1 Tax=Erwinia sorbitola TaxID=2681984 RepID=A0ABW9RGW9_9GAMM|nr:ankyrin repeat domain-containing protein [Erwinia sorbitola]MTD28769.1 hypothetical protein [Erwinia sorbitola]